MKVQVVRGIAAGALLSCSLGANAYIGPGLGVGAAAVVLGIVFAVFLLIVGLIWYPIRRIMRTIAKDKEARQTNKHSNPQG